MPSKKNILIIGQGVIGTFLGATLIKNNDVTHYIRDKSKARTEITLRFTDRRNKSFRLLKGVQFEYDLTDNFIEFQQYDYILIPVLHDQFKNVVNSLRPHLTPKQILVIMGNIWDDFDWINKNIENPYLFAFPNFGGAILDNELKGWLTENLSTGVSNSKDTDELHTFINILEEVGFKPRIEKNIEGWLMTHFAYNAGMLLEASTSGGFQKMTKKFSSLKNMYLTIRECMNTVDKMGLYPQQFKEGRMVYQPIGWNVLKTYFMFLLPGLAKSADANKDIDKWKSYAERIWKSARQMKIVTPILDTYFIT